jgi:phosphoribosylanthranilate isomerase
VTPVKICGLTRLDDAARAVELGAWALGMVFWPGSPRRCPPDEAARIAGALRRQAELVGVFVDAPLDRVAKAADELGLSMVQLHGDEGPSYCAEAARRTGCRVIKAVPVRSQADLRALRSFHTDFHLLDSGAGVTPGGTGATWDWTLVSALTGGVPVIASGGLRPENVADAIATLRPYAVDSASGTEATPGVKDPAKLEAFFEAVAAAPVPAEAARSPAGYERRNVGGSFQNVGLEGPRR